MSFVFLRAYRPDVSIVKVNAAIVLMNNNDKPCMVRYGSKLCFKKLLGQRIVIDVRTGTNLRRIRIK